MWNGRCERLSPCPKPKPALWKVDLGTGSYISFDYQGEISRAFPDPNAYPRKSRQRWLMAARRECRGLLVDASTKSTA